MPARILIADDAASTLGIVEAMLSAAGYECVTASSGDQIEPLLRKRPVDLVLTDLYMPNQDGLEVITELRRSRPELPVIAMSAGTGRRNLLSVAQCLGARAVLLKPFSQAELLQAIDSALTVASRKPKETTQ